MKSLFVPNEKYCQKSENKLTKLLLSFLEDTIIMIDNIFQSTLGFFNKSRLLFSPRLNLGIANFHNGRLKMLQVSP